MKQKCYLLILFILVGLCGCNNTQNENQSPQTSKINDLEQEVTKNEKQIEDINDSSSEKSENMENKIIEINIENWNDYFEIKKNPVCDTSNNKMTIFMMNYIISLKDEYKEVIIPTHENRVIFSYNYINTAYEYELINLETLEYNILGLSKFNKNELVKNSTEYVYFENNEYEVLIGTGQWFGGEPPSLTLWDDFKITEVSGKLYFK